MYQRRDKPDWVDQVEEGLLAAIGGMSLLTWIVVLAHMLRA